MRDKTQTDWKAVTTAVVKQTLTPLEIFTRRFAGRASFYQAGQTILQALDKYA